MEREDTARPNVLFIICDDLNNAILGMGRRPCAPAPNLQRLISTGVRFPNAYSNCPVCLPARNALFSGLHAHSTGHFTLWDNWRTTTPIATTDAHGEEGWGKAFLQTATMIPKHFVDQGYGVFGAGKVLHEGVVDPDWWTAYAYGPDYGPFLWDVGGDTQRGRRDRDWLYTGEPFTSYVRRYEGVDRFFLDGQRWRHHIENAFGPLGDVFLSGTDARNGDGSVYRYASDDDRDPLPDERVAAWGVDVLERRHDDPFFLALGFMKPHTPLNVPRRYFDMFPPEELELPPFLSGDTDDCAGALVEHRPFGFLTYGLLMKGGEALWRQWLQAYLACVAFVDEQVGKVLDALEAGPYGDNALVVFTSDNGYHMGEKEYVFKDSLWEESCQIPLIIRAPGVAAEGGQCSAPVSHVDLYPTLTDLCGLPPEPHAPAGGLPLAGQTLRPLLAAPGLSERPGSPVALSSVRGDSGIHHSVRSATHRYTLCGNGEEELYDHRSDPHEWHNLAADPRHDAVRTDLRRELVQLVTGV